MKDIIFNKGDEAFLVSTADTMDRGWETMIFSAKAGPFKRSPSELVTDWQDLYQDLYDTEEEAEQGHQRAIKLVRGEF